MALFHKSNIPHNHLIPHKYQELVHNINVGIYRSTAGPKGHYIEINPAMAELFEAESTEELMKKSPCDLYADPNKRKYFSDKMLDIGAVKNEIFEYKTLKGNYFWGANTALLVKTANGELFFDGAIIDVSEQIKVEELLQHQLSLNKKYLDVAGVIMVALNKDGRVIMINNKGCEIFGYSKKEIIGKNWFDNFLPKNIAEETRKVSHKLFKNKIKNAEYHENNILCKNGEEKLIAWHNTVLVDDQGKTFALLSSGEDITDRIKINNALKESEAKNRALLNAIPDLVFTINKEGYFTNYSGKKEDLYLNPEEFIGKNVHEVLPESLAKLTMDKLNNVFHNNGIEKYEYYLPIQGEKKYFEARMVFSDENSAVVIIRNITETKFSNFELCRKIKELEYFYEATIGRELKLIELEKEVNELLVKLGKAPKYTVDIDKSS